MGQWSNEGSLCAYPPSERRLALATSLEEHEGNLRHTAHALGYHRSRIYQLVYQYRLWPVINRLRTKRLERKARERRRS